MLLSSALLCFFCPLFQLTLYVCHHFLTPSTLYLINFETFSFSQKVKNFLTPFFFSLFSLFHFFVRRGTKKKKQQNRSLFLSFDCYLPRLTNHNLFSFGLSLYISIYREIDRQIDIVMLFVVHLVWTKQRGCAKN